MRFYPTKIQAVFLCFILTSIGLNFGCSKDSDLLTNALIDDSISSLEERDQDSIEEDSTDEVEEEESTTEEPQNDTLESRTTSFSPTNDAHFQSGKGYNQNIIRLEEGHRTSYLMFDLDPIGAIEGTLTSATLQFTINSDDGNGLITVSKGITSDWNENNLTEGNIPEAGVELGSIIKEYKIGVTEIVDLEAGAMTPDLTTFILDHKNGNDLAFASKEHTSKIGPKLVVTYDVAPGSDEIEIIEEQVQEEESSQDNEEEGSQDNEEEGSQDNEEEGSQDNEEEGSQDNEEEGSQDDEEEGSQENEEEENEEPMAVADATPSSGGVPLEVTFKGSNSSDDNGIQSYSWDFKDESGSEEIDPTHTFTKAGIYVVELTVTDAEGLTNTDMVTITVNEKKNEAPKAVVSATPVSGEVPLEVSFKGSDSTDDDSISSYSWDFKDGSKTNRADFTYTYDEPGIYEAELTVKDENGLFDKETITITVTEAKNVAPVAVVTTNVTSGIAPLDVQFTGNKSTDDKGISSYAWDFKDGATGNTANPSHKFTEAGTYEVELTVKDEEGLTNKKRVTITVNEPENEAPLAVVTANPKNGEAPLDVQFVGHNSSDDNKITSYHWDFKDGTTATNINPSHTFTSEGTYVVELTVKDADGLTNKKSITITVEAESGNGGGNVPPGYYVTTSGKASNNGKSQGSAWSLEHAFNAAKAGDIIYVKAGNYGNKQLRSNNGGTSGNPIKFIGYQNTPGDIVSSQESTMNYGQSVNASRMPLLQSSNGQGKAITLHDRYIEIENFQITGYSHGVETISIATNAVLKNIIITKVGNQSNKGSYSGIGFAIEGNNTLIENCLVVNAGAEAYKLFDSDNSRIRYSKAYANNHGNPTDYYFLITGGTNNSIIENCYAERVVELVHPGHGFIMKDLAQYNTFRNCTVKNTKLALNFSGVKNNLIDNCTVIGRGTSSSDWEASIAIKNGANNNVIKNTKISNVHQAINLADDDDGYVGPGGDRDEVSLGYNNTFENMTITNVSKMLKIGGGNQFSAKASNYTFKNCSLTNFKQVAVTYYRTENFKFQNCSFKNGEKLVIEFGEQYAPYSKFNVSWQNCTWSNVDFNPPN